jgi:hypothetical protein
MAAAERPGFSCRLAAFDNATDTAAGRDSETRKSSDLARRKAVNCNPMLGGGPVMVIGQGVGWLCNAMVIFEYRPDRFE